ncbi:MAG: sortase [Rubrobacter sp.]|nr:sortase [Rubrobacter sp.]
MRIGNIILNLVSVALVGAGLALIGTFFVGPAFLNPDTSASAAPGKFSVPVLNKKAAEPPTVESGTKKNSSKKQTAYAPEDKTLRVSIPKMSRVRDSVMPTAEGSNEELLKDNAGIHLKGTGYPWEKGANVYLAGHRLGYPSTESFLAFFDLDKLGKGDEILITDSNGEKYTYRVYKSFIVDPSDVFVTRPVPGKNIVTLQTCTLPDYSRRLIVQAEKVA